eukprot:1719960-Rhodomonas_salina.3
MAISSFSRKCDRSASSNSSSSYRMYTSAGPSPCPARTVPRQGVRRRWQQAAGRTSKASGGGLTEPTPNGKRSAREALLTSLSVRPSDPALSLRACARCTPPSSPPALLGESSPDPSESPVSPVLFASLFGVPSIVSWHNPTPALSADRRESTDQDLLDAPALCLIALGGQMPDNDTLGLGLGDQTAHAPVHAQKEFADPDQLALAHDPGVAERVVVVVIAVRLGHDDGALDDQEYGAPGAVWPVLLVRVRADDLLPVPGHPAPHTR